MHQTITDLVSSVSLHLPLDTAIQSSNSKVYVWLPTAWIILLPSQVAGQVHLAAVAKWLYPVSVVLITKGPQKLVKPQAPRRKPLLLNVTKLKRRLENFQSQLCKTEWRNWDPWLQVRISFTSSLSWARKRGSKCSIVLSLPRMVERPIMTEARADFTCWLVSETSSWRQKDQHKQIVKTEST